MNATTSNQTTKSRKAYKYIAVAFIAALIAVSTIWVVNQNTVEASATVTASALSVANEVNAAYDTTDTQEAINEERAIYNFASIQTGSNLKVTAGDEANTQIGFYNVDGNRTTHITLVVAEAPEGWEVEIDSALTVEVTELMEEPVEQLEEGTKSVVLGSRGYTVARIANIKINAPEDVEEGTIGEIKITVKAEWLGQTGQVAICQIRNFNYSVEVISDDK